MLLKFILSFLLTLPTAFADIPSRYIELLDYVQVGPDQGETSTCLFVASTGAMELLANKKNGIKNPAAYGPYDLSESFLIHAPNVQSAGKYSWEIPVLRFNAGFGIHLSEWDYTAWNGHHENKSVWSYRDWQSMKKTTLPKVDTIPLFVVGNKYSTGVLNQTHVQKIKEALWKYKSPVLVNYNDDGFWHVVVIVGYDDELPGTCYDQDTPASVCNKDVGSFYVRDSFGIPVEVRDYDWFRVKGNAAFVVREAL